VSEPKKPQRCDGCSKKTKHECGRVVCGNRKPLTAAPPDGTPAGGGKTPKRRSTS